MNRTWVGRALLGLVIVLYYFRFAEYDWGMIPTFSPVGDCLMRGSTWRPAGTLSLTHRSSPC